MIHADHDMLKELEITAVGQRIALLKAIYNIKVQNGIPFEEDDYIPESTNLYIFLDWVEIVVDGHHNSVVTDWHSCSIFVFK